MLLDLYSYVLNQYFLGISASIPAIGIVRPLHGKVFAQDKGSSDRHKV